MHLLLIGPEARQRDQVRNFSGVWSHYLTRELEAAGVSVSFEAPLNRSGMGQSAMIAHYARRPLAGIDHVVALGTRYFDKVPTGCAIALKKRFAGAVTQIHDGHSRVPVDCTFTVKQVGAPRHHCIGWAADPDVCRPNQDPDVLGVLVDHPDYVPTRGDRTKAILDDVARFIRSGAWRERFGSVRVRRIADAGVVDGFAPLTRYSRQGMPFAAIAREYSQAHLFLVTHRESVGLSVLETAMAGALPVTPKDFVPRDRLATVRHVEFSGDRIPWPDVLEAIDPVRSREKALENTWQRVASRMVGWLEAFRR